MIFLGVSTTLEGGRFSFPCPRHSPEESEPWKERWSFRKNHVLLRAEEMIKLKRGVEDTIAHRARSKDLDSGGGCRKPRRTCNQALDLDLETSFPEHLTGRAFNSLLIQSFTAV